MIMNAIKARDEKAAKEAMRGHLERSKRNYEEYLQRQQEG